MTVILDIEGFASKTYEGYLARTLFTELAKTLPNDHFLYPAPKREDLPPNMSAVALPSNTGIFRNKKVEKFLRERPADVFISSGRVVNTSLPVKQILFITGYLSSQSEKYFPVASVIGFTSAWVKRRFEKKHPSLRHKAFIIPGVVQNDMIELEAQEKQDQKEKWTEGREYFICADFDLTKEKCINLLKAFSVFKKMQQSNWKLMLVLRSENLTDREVAGVLQHYKFRDDVVVTGDENPDKKIAAAYSLISISEAELFPVPVLEALHAGTPVIALHTHTLKDICGDAVIYPENNSYQAIGDMMMMIYKAENYKHSIIAKGREISKSISVAIAVKALREALKN